MGGGGRGELKETLKKTSLIYIFLYNVAFKLNVVIIPTSL